MSNYRIEEDGMGTFVRDTESGKVIPYHSKAVKYGILSDYPEEFYEWFRYSNSKRKKIKEETMYYGKPIAYPTSAWKTGVLLGNLEKLPTPQSISKLPWSNPGMECVPQQKQGNNPMNYAYTNTAAATIVADTSEKDKRQYLASRLSELRYEKTDELRGMFRVNEPKPPKTPKEALDRLLAGKFTIEGADKDEKPSWSFDFYDNFSWRDPSQPKDEEGYSKAFRELTDFLDSLKDIVMVKPIDEAFDTLKALQDWQPTGKPN